MIYQEKIIKYFLVLKKKCYNKNMIIVGLGNPGEKFKNTRHNLGFEVLDEIQQENGFPEFSFAEKFKAEISQGIINGEKTILVKPQTFMNTSGESVKLLINYYKLKESDLIVIHDDIDIPLGEVKVSGDSGSAGHKGVLSIIDAIGTKDFKRIRIGILPTKGKPSETEKFVLKKFTKKEKTIIQETIEDIKKLI